VALAAGGNHTCALLSDGSVDCWGSMTYLPPTPNFTPMPVPNLSGAVALSSGRYYACVLMPDGTVRCWGENDYGVLSPGVSSLTVPVTIPVLSGVMAVATGPVAVCALLGNGTVRCWGDNASNVVAPTGAPLTDNFLGPPVANVSGATAIAVGYTQACALLSDGTVRCWGNQSATAVSIPGLNGVVGIYAAEGDYCALLAGGTVRCWGDDRTGQLGNGTAALDGGANSSTPVAVSNISNAVSLSVGLLSACALLSNGDAQCWGDNSWGELGDGTTVSSSVPMTVKW
jgi:alpha-tubulin suppressor-like RCC1 family protein